jgi:uncharacterized membrane protein
MTEQTGFQLVIATFTDETTAATAVKRLLTEFQGRRAALPAAAYVGKSAGGELTIRETADLGGKQGAAAGALAGGLVGLLSRRRGVVGSAALGALLGGVVAKKLDTGIPDPRLAAIGAALDEATGAAVAIVDDEVAHTALALLKGLGAQTQSEPFARETDFMKQLQAGDLAGAANTLANQAEGALAGATTMAVERAEALGGPVRPMAYDAEMDEEIRLLTDDELPSADDEPLTMTDEEQLEDLIAPDAAAVMTDPTTTMTPGISVRPDDDMKRVPDTQPAQVAGAGARPDSDAGGLARGDIDPAAAGLSDIMPPAV